MVAVDLLPPLSVERRAFHCSIRSFNSLLSARSSASLYVSRGVLCFSPKCVLPSLSLILSSRRRKIAAGSSSCAGSGSGRIRRMFLPRRRNNRSRRGKGPADFNRSSLSKEEERAGDFSFPRFHLLLLLPFIPRGHNIRDTGSSLLSSPRTPPDASPKCNVQDATNHSGVYDEL